jgi:hypothetical protein
MVVADMGEIGPRLGMLHVEQRKETKAGEAGKIIRRLAETGDD